MKLIAAIFAFFIFTAPAIALGLHHSAAPAAPAPVLTATTVTFGQQTQEARGYVFLHTQDLTVPSYQPFTTSGLGLMSPSGPACDHWTMTFVSNTAGRPGSDWYVISANTADASAISPSPSNTGVTHLAGDYVWNVQCSASGQNSNIVAMTIHTVNCEANIAQQDRLDFGWAPDPGFGSCAGSKLVLSTGSDWHGLFNRLRGVTLGSTAGNHLTITIADAGRYPYITDLNITGLSYADLSDIVAVGNTDLDGVGAIFGAVGPFTSTGNTLSNLRYYGSEYTIPTSSQNSGQASFALDNCGGADGCILQNSSADFVNGGFDISDTIHASNVVISHYNNNCWAVGSGTVGGTVDNFSTCVDPLINTAGIHTDCLQILDGATAWNIVLKNVWCIQAGGPGDPQGPLFGGSQLGSKNDVGLGYVDDCTGGHGPGHYLTLTAGFYQSSSGGAQVWAPGGGLPISDNARLNFNDVIGSCVGLVTGGTGANISSRNVGSVGTPVSISNVGAYNLQMEGVVATLAGFNGFASAGESGTSFLRHSTYQQQKQNPFPTVSFTGQINGVVGSHASGTTITVSGPGTSNYPSTYEPIIGGYINYAGCTNCDGRTAGSQGICCELSSTEAVQASAMASFSGKTMTVTGPCTGRFDYNIINGSSMGGLMISGAGLPEGVSIVPQIFLPTDGCAGGYQLNTNVGTIGSIAVTGRPQNGAGLYAQFGTAATPVGPLAMTSTEADVVNQGEGASVTQDQSGGSPGCVSRLHQGTFTISKVLATYVSTCNSTDAPNTTVTNIVQTGVAADFATGVLPYTSLAAIPASTWDAMTVAQKRAYACGKILPAVGHSLDLGSGDYIGAVTATGEIQLAGGNQAVTGCGIH